MQHPDLITADPTRGRKHVVFTAIFGNSDELLEPRFVDPACDYICFTDQPTMHSTAWRIVHCPRWHDDPVRAAKAYKILSHLVLPHHLRSIWIDGNIVPISDLMVESMDVYLTRHPMAAFRHPERECIYDELQACIDLGKDTPSLMKHQVLSYIKNGFPPRYGLIYGGILIRDHASIQAKNINNLWWEEIQKHSRRDQLSFDYLRWKTGFQVEYLEYSLAKNPLFFLTFHGSNSNR
jgi:hypothetical protein